MSQTNSKKKLGIWMSTSLVVGNMIGAGIFLMPAALAAYGGISVIGWLVSAAGALLLARVFSKLSLLIPNSNGGPYAFSKAGFGDYLGFLVAWGYWISIWVSNAAIAIAFVAAMSVFFPVLAESRVAAVLAALAAIWLLTWINSLGIRESGKVQLLTTALKLIPLFLVIAFGFFFFDISNFTPFNTSGDSSLAAIAITATMTFYAFLGFECATIPAANVENPKKTVPRATMIGTIVTTIFYILSTAVVMGMIPMDILAQSPAPFADAMAIIGGEWGKNLVAGGAAIAAFGALNGWILVQGQIARATAMDDLFPPIFKSDNRNGVPIWGLVIGSALTSVVMLMNYTEGLVEQFRFMVLLTTLCSLIPYLFSAAAYVLIGVEKLVPGKNAIAIHLLGGFAFLFTLWAIYGAGERTVFWGTILLLSGTPFYVWIKRKR
ncbi:MAG: amino acid permease [Flavobacteriaceae bacterium]